MTERHINKLTKIDARLQLLNEERLALLNERQALIRQHEVELAQNFNVHASPEQKINLFFHILKAVTMFTHLGGNQKTVEVVIHLLVGMNGNQRFATNQKSAVLNVKIRTLKYLTIKLFMDI
jgi:hypothetical protein